VIEIHIGPSKQQISGRAEMRFVGPVLAIQTAREKSFAEMFDLSVTYEEAGSVFGHGRVLVGPEP
jgi:hypothetical protein